MTKAANNSVPDYTSINAVCTKTKINDGDSLWCIADSDASTLWDSCNESISHESDEEHSAASTFLRALNLAKVVMRQCNRGSFFDLGFVEHVVGLSKGI
jgi:hypothetical protein